MASKHFKSEITRRFVEVVKYLMMSEAVHSKTEIGLLMDQPLQVVSKLLTGQRIITLEQTRKLILNTNVNAHWVRVCLLAMAMRRGSTSIVIRFSFQIVRNF